MCSNAAGSFLCPELLWRRRVDQPDRRKLELSRGDMLLVVTVVSKATDILNSFSLQCKTGLCWLEKEREGKGITS